MNTKPIAVFDSGVGGISVLRELVHLMPNENFIYYGDSANAPYGGRPVEEVQKLTLAAADMLIKRGVKALVVACNTATAAAIHLLRETYPDTIIIGIEPALKLAADRFPEGRVGIMATEVTLREEKLAIQLKRFPGVQAELIAAPRLVELIEAGKADSAETEMLLTKILSPYKDKLDALVLGCTHYPFAVKAIRKVLGDTALLDGSLGTAKQTQRCLQDRLNPGPGSVQMENSLHSPEILQLSMALLEDTL